MTLKTSSSPPPTAKLFMHGRSQAVRLPKAFRLPGTEVLVRKVGRSVVLEPIGTTFEPEAWFAQIDAVGGAGFLPDGIPEDAPIEPDTRRFFAD